jgi:hypothetical protein
VLGSRLGVGAAKNTTAANDSTSLVAVGLTKSQTSGSRSGSANNEFLFSGEFGVR